MQIKKMGEVRVFVEYRTQKSVGGSNNKFGGPDTYVAVQVVPVGVERLRALNRDAAKKRGIHIEYCGEGYSRNSGPKSMLGRAIAKAKEYAARFEYAVARPLTDDEETRAVTGNGSFTCD